MFKEGGFLTYWNFLLHAHKNKGIKNMNIMLQKFIKKNMMIFNIFNFVIK